MIWVPIILLVMQVLMHGWKSGISFAFVFIFFVQCPHWSHIKILRSFFGGNSTLQSIFVCLKLPSICTFKLGEMLKYDAQDVILLPEYSVQSTVSSNDVGTVSHTVHQVFYLSAGWEIKLTHSLLMEIFSFSPQNVTIFYIVTGYTWTWTVDNGHVDICTFILSHQSWSVTVLT